MVKKILIGVGLFLILGLMTVWAYLLIFGVPDEAAEFVGFEFAGSGAERVYLPPQSSDTVNTEQEAFGGQLQQLTTRPVAGFGLIERSIRYVERGTGHVYEIDLDNGQERRLSGTTIAKVVDAVFSPNGSIVALTTEVDTKQKIVLLTINGSGSSQNELPLNSHSVGFTENNLVRYAVAGEIQSVLYERNPATGEVSELNRVPFTDIDIHWNEDAAYIINKTAENLKGNLYRVNENGLTAFHPSEPVFTAMLDDTSSLALESFYDEETDQMVSMALDLNSLERRELPFVIVPEKCDFSEIILERVWCATPSNLNNTLRKNYINDWYKGTFSDSDQLWRVELGTQQSWLVSDLLEATGLTVDVDKMTMESDNLIFTNRLNDTLWLFELD